MNELLLLVGLLPLIIVSIVFLAKKKLLVAPIIMLVLSVGALAAAVLVPSDDEGDKKKKSGGGFDWNSYMAASHMLSGNEKDAKFYWDEMYYSMGDTEESVVSSFRMNLVSGDMSKAMVSAKTLALYMEEFEVALLDEEEKFVKAVSDGSYESYLDLKAEQAMYEQLEESGSDPKEYGYRAVSDDEIEERKEEFETLMKVAEEKLKEDVENYQSDDVNEDLMEAYTKVKEAYTEYAAAAPESEEAKAAIAKIEKAADDLYDLYKDDSSVFEVEEFKDAYLNAVTVTKDVDKLIDYAVDTKDADALALVANFYTNGIVTEKDFPRDYIDSDNYSDVIEKCEDIYKEMDKDDLSNAEVNKLENKIASMELRNEEPVLSKLEEDIKPEDVSADKKSETYIQDSSLNAALSDKEAAFESLEKAIENVNTSDNKELQLALNNINNIIENENATDEIVDLNTYLEEAYQSSLPTENNVVITPESFVNTGNSYANEQRAMINIGIIKTDEFETIKAYVSTSGLDLMAGDLLITDCGLVIDDYEIEKVDIKKSQIMLVCDTSYSMDESNSIEPLKVAVTQFIDSMNSKEEVGIITFAGDVVLNQSFTSDNDTLHNTVSQFGPVWGTVIKNGVDGALQHFTAGDDVFKAIIVMTDGQDSSYNDGNLNELRQICIDNNIVLYTIGLGGVNPTYLQNLADAGMGSFVYCSDNVQLTDLYTFLHNQVDNVYCVTYKAKDVYTEKNRVLTITDNTEGYSGKRSYSLTYDTGEDNGENTNDNPLGIRVGRLGVSTVVKPETGSCQFTIVGTGFEDATAISVSLGEAYTGLACEVVDNNKISVTVPTNVEVGTYDVNISINGADYVLKGLKIVPAGMPDSVQFGEYIFSAYSIVQDGNTISLSGEVTMNDYLHFKGDVTLSGDLEGNVMSVIEADGSYIYYEEKLPGLLGLVFENTISFPSFSSFSIYTEEDKYDEIGAYGGMQYGPIKVDTPSVQIKPEMVSFVIPEMKFDFPGLDDLFDYMEEDNPFVFNEVQVECMATAKEVGIDLEVPVPMPEGELKLGPAKLSMDGLTLKYNSIDHTGGIDLDVKMEGVKIFADNDGVGFGFSIEIEEGMLDGFELRADIDVPIVKTPPVSLSSFFFGIHDFVKKDDNGNVIPDRSVGKKLLDASWKGGCDVNVCSTGDVLPILSEFADGAFDITILKFEEASFELVPSEFSLTLSTSAQLLECVDLGSVTVKIGKFEYENYILDKKEVGGLEVIYDRGIDFAIEDYISFEFSSGFSATINSKFSGISAAGDVICDVDILTFDKTYDLSGDAVMGLYKNGDGMMTFTILVKGKSHTDNKTVGFRIDVTDDGWFLPDAEVQVYR